MTSDAAAPPTPAGATWRVFVGYPDRSIVHLDQGGLSWDEARRTLREWAQLYDQDDRDDQRVAATDLIELLDDDHLHGKAVLTAIAGEWHAIMHDYRHPAGCGCALCRPRQRARPAGSARP